MKPVNKLKELALEDLKKQHHEFPEYAIPIPKYSDKTANGLTKMIIDYIKFNGGQAERISVVSRKVAGKFVKSTMTKGTADISATIPTLNYADEGYNKWIGVSVKIEVKIGKDRQSEEQKKYEKQIKNAHGYYFIAKDFNSFYTWYHENF